MENIMRLDRSEITSKHKITLPFFALDDRLDKIRKKKKKQMALNYIFIEQ
jgi:hypothetical protein